MTADQRSDWHKGFVAGLAYAATFVSRGHHEETIAADLLNESGYQLRDFAQVAPYDLKELRRLYRTERKLKRSKR